MALESDGKALSTGVAPPGSLVPVEGGETEGGRTEPEKQKVKSTGYTYKVCAPAHSHMRHPHPKIANNGSKREIICQQQSSAATNRHYPSPQRA